MRFVYRVVSSCQWIPQSAELYFSGRPNFLEELKEAGYQVVMYGKNHALDAAATKASLSIYDGCDGSKGQESVWRDTEETRKKRGRHLFSDDYTMLFPAMDDDELEEMHDTQIVRQSVAFIEQWKPTDPPFFLFISINAPMRRMSARNVIMICTRRSSLYCAGTGGA